MTQIATAQFSSFNVIKVNDGRSRISIIIALSAMFIAIMAAATLVHFNTESTPITLQNNQLKPGNVSASTLILGRKLPYPG